MMSAARVRAVGVPKAAAVENIRAVLRNANITFNHHNNDIITGINVAHYAGNGCTRLVG